MTYFYSHRSVYYQSLSEKHLFAVDGDYRDFQLNKRLKSALSYIEHLHHAPLKGSEIILDNGAECVTQEW